MRPAKRWNQAKERAHRPRKARSSEEHQQREKGHEQFGAAVLWHIGERDDANGKQCLQEQEGEEFVALADLFNLATGICMAKDTNQSAPAEQATK